MQIALDTVIYLVLALTLFSLVISFFPKIEELSKSSLIDKGLVKSKEELVQRIVAVYLGEVEEEVVLLNKSIAKEELKELLEKAGMREESFVLNFSNSTSLVIRKLDKKVVISG